MKKRMFYEALMMLENGATTPGVWTPQERRELRAAIRVLREAGRAVSEKVPTYGISNDHPLYKLFIAILYARKVEGK